VFFIVENIKDRLLFFFFIVMNKAKNFVVGVIILDLGLTLSAILFLHMGAQDGVWEYKMAYGSTRWRMGAQDGVWEHKMAHKKVIFN
jgi:hypothetical protein